jgi:hypothetical protein
MFFRFNKNEWVNLEKVERIVIEKSDKEYRVTLRLESDRSMWRYFNSYDEAEDFVRNMVRLLNHKEVSVY